jgi:[acyl-carrier-protein] S-malonyltransferase
MALALLCSGQSWQASGMFALTGDIPDAAALFSHAATLLGGYDPREIVSTETHEVLHRNRIGQILCTLQALAAAAALREVMLDRVVVAGYSIGELAAWGVAGAMDGTDTLNLAAKRAEAMDAAASPDEGMLFVRGLPRAVIDRLCLIHGVAVAIVEPGDAFVLGGSRTALKDMSVETKAIGATRSVDLPVGVASHTRLLALASPAFCSNLSQVRVAELPIPGMRILSGIDGSPVLDAKAGLEKLAAQISQTVQWSACLQGCIESGATAFLELGPGSALSKMAASAYPDVASRSLGEFRTLQGVRAWLTQHS